MGVDEAGQQDDFAEVENLLAATCGCKSGHEPTARMRFPEMTTAPFSIGGRETGRTVRARRIIGM